MIPLVIAGAVILALIVAAVVVMRGKSTPKGAGAATYRELLGVGQAGTSAENTDPEITDLRQNLRVKLLYQEDKIDAAIAVERERNPSGTLADLMRAAIKRWERDNQ